MAPGPGVQGDPGAVPVAPAHAPPVPGRVVVAPALAEARRGRGRRNRNVHVRVLGARQRDEKEEGKHAHRRARGRGRLQRRFGVPGREERRGYLRRDRGFPVSVLKSSSIGERGFPAGLPPAARGRCPTCTAAALPLYSPIARACGLCRGFVAEPGAPAPRLSRSANGIPGAHPPDVGISAPPR